VRGLYHDITLAIYIILVESYSYTFAIFSCLISDSTKTIRLLSLDFYEMIVDSGFPLINYQLIEISSS
jgi:hypothetical protein